ncbi:hypothetical protein JTE90_024353 [Oedothorax gibbosus]|uniref:Uncharacterized protein n=1 Tax=Oedothorax gibbosus TaxID=931172 RepID=A0AAV6W0C3_9ARAC|nr:hypothetical protein JTE90_024353 [Oedothorax gibbosus]
MLPGGTATSPAADGRRGGGMDGRVHSVPLSARSTRTFFFPTPMLLGVVSVFISLLECLPITASFVYNFGCAGLERMVPGFEWTIDFGTE